MIWVFLTLVALTAVLALFSPLRREQAASPLDHFRAQLSEIKEDAERGIIDEASAQAARLEVERRILKAAKGEKGGSLMGGDKRLPAVLAALMLVAAVALYSFMGRPELPARPGVVVAGRDAPIEEGGPTFGEAIRSVRAHLEDQPGDIQGWEILAKSSRAVRDFSAAANAFAELAELDPSNHTWRIQQLESMMAMAGGQITPAAKLVLGKLIEDAPDHPAGQYYLGLARLQAGDADGARAVWQSLADRSDPNAPWMPSLRQQMAGLGVQAPAISQDQMAAVENMSDEDRQAFIGNMMERLATRLESAPDDPQGWLMLARSHLTMGDREAAIATLERGLAQVSDQNKPQIKALLDNLKPSPDL